MKKFIILALLFLSTACYSQISVTTIIVPFTPGGSYDILGRKFAQFAQIKTGRPFVVENIPGTCTKSVFASPVGWSVCRL